MTRVYIGIDDTDAEDSPGTGKVARGLTRHLEGLGYGTSVGVTRHQLLVDPAIPYTSHNSALCLCLESALDLGVLERACVDYLMEGVVDGADPALCVALHGAVTSAMGGWGGRAKMEVLGTDEAVSIVDGTGVVLRSIAGGPHGVIGALAAVGLRARGNDGRFVDLPGIREVRGVASVERILRDTAVVGVTDAGGSPLSADQQINTNDWVRPSVVDGAPVLKVRRDPDNSKWWVPYELTSRSSRRYR